MRKRTAGGKSTTRWRLSFWRFSIGFRIITALFHKKKRQFSFGRLSFLFVLFTFIFSLFSLLLNCRFQRKDKSEKRREKVALLRKALNYIIICGIIQSEVMTNEQSFAR